ncbi:MAG: hypothetical protein WCL11_01670 [Verrucomicrobiota bacterium]
MKTKTIRNVLIIVPLAGLILAGSGYGAYRVYVHARQTSLLKQARTLVEKANTRKAQICLQRVLRADPRNVEACRLMAELNDAGRSPGALFWRNRVVELKPDSMNDRLALAKTALSMRDYATATNTMEGIDAAGKKTAAYHNLAGTVASTLNQIPAAEEHFIEAARLEPSNPVPQLNLAVLRLHGTNAPALAEARTVLKRISANPTNATLRCQALRELVVDALRTKQPATALALAGDLMRQTNSTFSDRLLRLTVIEQTGNAGLRAELADSHREAARGTNAAAKTCDMTLWHMQNGKVGAREALTWLGGLPDTIQTNQSVALLIAECQIAIQDWRSLQAALEKQDWAELEFLRHAYKARSLRGQDLTGAAQGEWVLALKAANRQKGSLAMLLRLAERWKWQSEKEELLWSIVNQYPGEREAFNLLSRALMAGGRTQSLMMLYSQEAKRRPSDLSVKNNLAMTALLLGAKEIKPHELAREVYQAAPDNPSFASTYAFSLHLQKKDAEALKLMQQLRPGDLEAPAIAGYYALILQATGEREKAKAYFQWGFRAQLLPEEKGLFNRARAGA